MIWRFVAVTFLLTLIGGATADGVPEDLSFIQSMIDPYVDCKFGTLSCSEDCKNVMICLGGTNLEVVEKCPNGTLCDTKTSSCSADLKTCNVVNQTDFTCHGTVRGNFPNPYDCHSYFYCPEDSEISSTPTSAGTSETTSEATTETTSEVTSEATTASTTAALLPEQFLEDMRDTVKGTYHNCTRNTTAYDALSGTCRFSSNHRVCKEGPVPKCTTLLQSGGLIENPNIYYVCVSVGGVLQPWLAKCAEATDVFQDGKCVTPSDSLHQPRWVRSD